MTPHEAINLKIEELSAAISSSLPSMPTLLRTIHANLKNDPELVTILTPEQVGIVVSGLMRQTQTTIATSVLSGGKGKSMKKVSLDDI